MNMLTKILLVVGGVFAVSVACSNITYAGPVSDAASAVHKLSVGGKVFGSIDATVGNCSAVAVSPTQIVTAAHCVQFTLDNIIRVDNITWNPDIIVGGDFQVLSSQFYYLNRVRTYKDQDVALMEIADPNFKFETYATICEDYEPEIGDEMMAIGFPRADKKMITDGRFGERAALPDLGFEGPFWKVSAPIIGGNSGGGLFIEQEDGTLCLTGIASAAYPFSFESYFAPLSSVKKVTKNLLKLD